jgi:L-amino acid N-acyltransferase YncA
MSKENKVPIMLRAYTMSDIDAMSEIWNSVVEAGDAFPQTEKLSSDTAEPFFASQSFTAVAVDTDSNAVVGLYILHPNNIGRCGHIANASYAVDARMRGFGIGEALVKHSLTKVKELGFKILQFNAVVATNASALHLYEKLKFTPLGTIPGGFRMINGEYEDIVPFYKSVE